MQGAIRNIATLKKWFLSNGVPFFTLSYAGQANQIIQRNTAIEELDQAWELLETNVLGQAEYGRATMSLIVYNKGSGANNPIGRTNIDILPINQQNGNQVAGIGQLPAGYMDKSEVQKLIDDAKEKWELEKRLEDLEIQISNPADVTEKWIQGIERIGASPLGQVIMMKLLGGPLPTIQPAPINGAPAPADEGGDTFEDDIEATAQILGVDDTVLARQLRRLVESNPEMAKQILQQQ